MAKKVESVEVEQTFAKEQLLKSKRYQDSVDLVGALLVDGQSYTLNEVDNLVDKFLKGKVQ